MRPLSVSHSTIIHIHMHSEYTNLIPPERQRAFRHDYFIRLGVVATALAVSLVLAAAVLLLPTYVLLAESAKTEKARLAGIQSTASSSDEAILSAQLTALSNNAATLLSLAKTRSVSPIISTVLAISRSGVTLSGFAYALNKNKGLATIAVSGTAATRDALRSYQIALQGAPFARSADLPVSAYAKDADIAFTITITLVP